ncbi:TetR/AcrR family transcriptional regulator [Phycicoccus sonneratiae]|uniref:TetR/AcrR family transcriptional regulator n=1 Tax=Phycicoccus sonneratiae TaxID=2807628 RepID=A0ABS2CGJ4_9MICO|nr:TetR/AcrR family transcriptional regulator [Phycicoccus sonneraticus]MBM6398997.1 TetR/AcrR family transcriptional regulator [Phycicoccus sonneraticus]
MPDPVKTRRYRSPRRAEQAAATRRAVLLAARDLFIAEGYAGTAVAEVARRAGVSVDTVYSSVGRKPALLLAVHDMTLAGGDEALPSTERDYVATVRAAPTTRAKLEMYAAAMRERLPHVVPLVEALREAATTDPACRATWEALETRRADNMQLLARDLRAGGGLRPDLDDAEVAHRLWIGNSAAYYRLCTAGGRSPEHYAALVLETWTSTLLAD